MSHILVSHGCSAAAEESLSQTLDELIATLQEAGLRTSTESQNVRASLLDRLITVTVFNDLQATTKREVRTCFYSMRDRIQSRTALSKSALPLLKLGRFGSAASSKGSLRHNENFLSLDGIEADYDRAEISFDDAAGILRTNELAALLYTSPSHIDPNRARLRILCPTAKSLPPAQRASLVARLNGIFKGALARESFTDSQAYYYGSVNSNPLHRSELIEGRGIDEADELDSLALGPTGDPWSAPEVSADAAEARSVLALTEPVDPLRAAADWERIRSALDAIPADARDDREGHWLPIGMALHAHSAGDEYAFDVWDEWSQGGSKYDARDQRRVWNSFRDRPGKRLGLGSLFHLATAHGWNPTGKATVAVPAASGRLLEFLTVEACSTAPTRGYIVKGCIAPRDFGCFFGQPGAGKSVIAPHIGYMVASGQPAFGLKTKAGGVFYVAAEDAHGMQGRISALKVVHGETSDFFLVKGVTDLFSPDSPQLAELLAEVAERKPTLIFVDTLAAAAVGLEENKAEAMSVVVAACRSLTNHGAAVMLIHHDTKGEGNTPRGHSVLNGALDMALHLIPRGEDGIVRGKLTKNRNGPCDLDIAFRIASHEVGTDEDGEPVTAAIAEELSAGSVPKAERLPASEKGALQVLTELLQREGQLQPDGRLAVTEESWRAECIGSGRVSASDKADSRRRAVERAIAGLAQRTRVVIREGRVSLPSLPGPANVWENGAATSAVPAGWEGGL